MLSSRSMQAAFKFAACQHSPFVTTVRTSALKASATYQIRSAATTSTTPVESIPAEQSEAILKEQRLRRPVAPHISIYQPQLTWYLSSLNRIAGVTLSGGTYLFALGYLASPYLGWHLESATLAAAFGALPLAAKLGIKTVVAAPFSFHYWNKIRHLVWDTGRFLDLKGVYATGYTVLGLTALTTVGLVLM
ncbi:succinate dehydrogenase cytochrome b560 subunit [Terfezia boudieri ATCC MYA-4762]|uniref:Succinate dehydrogenase cytochrome b560 subunit n=1 Tax=Terfezia boudieri ATCC MYA-4762 TaxID=1051890 RepID=A0A3N4LKW2_9PEZI|nr:succinate dehydrogenase cytochrome b560 subunit [Terfezia boudieri ATCC MYA-4762]